MCGKPLIQYTIEEALKSKYLSRIIVSSDDEDILSLAHKFKRVEARHRRKALASSTTPSIAVIRAILGQLKIEEKYIPDAVVLLQPTSPLRLAKDINKTIQRFIDNPECDSAVSVRTVAPFNIYVSNGAVFVSRTKTLYKYNNIRGDYVELYPMSEERSIDIDTDIDFIVAEQLMKKRMGK